MLGERHIFHSLCTIVSSLLNFQHSSEIFSGTDTLGVTIVFTLALSTLAYAIENAHVSCVFGHDRSVSIVSFLTLTPASRAPSLRLFTQNVQLSLSSFGL